MDDMGAIRTYLLFNYKTLFLLFYFIFLGVWEREHIYSNAHMSAGAPRWQRHQIPWNWNYRWQHEEPL